MHFAYHTIEEMTEMLPEPNRGTCAKIIFNNREHDAERMRDIK